MHNKNTLINVHNNKIVISSILNIVMKQIYYLKDMTNGRYL